MSDLNQAGQTLALFQPFECKLKHNPLKRAFDIVFSSIVLILSSPLFLIISIAILISSKGKGKIVYAHQRIGRGGKPFRCFKFRTMYPDADLRLKEILEKDSELKKEWEQNYKLKNDPRITPIGAFLRKTSLDEFPQFWNVLRGDLSIVGPRPVIRDEVEKQMGPKAAKILSIRPGLTGIWQVSGRNDTSYQKRVEMDIYYVDHHSFLLDLKLIFITIPCMFSSRGAY